MDHVALGVPVLVLAIPEDLDKLLQDSCLAPAAPLGKLCRIMVMAVHLSVMLVVAVLGPKDRRTERAGKMIDMILVIESGDVGSTKSPATLVA